VSTLIVPQQFSCVRSGHLRFPVFAGFALVRSVVRAFPAERERYDTVLEVVAVVRYGDAVYGEGNHSASGSDSGSLGSSVV